MGLISRYRNYRKQLGMNKQRLNNTTRDGVKELLHNKAILEIVDFMNNTKEKKYVINNDYEFRTWEYPISISARYISQYITNDTVLDVEVNYEDSHKRNEPDIYIKSTVYLLNQVVKYERRSKSFILHFNDKSSLWIDNSDINNKEFINRIVYGLPI